MQQPVIQTIGTVEYVSFPKFGLVDVPAKIDTGADSSAIWASEISLDSGGRLGFVLFDKSSQLYTGERITVESFRSSMVRNTSGISEARYKVALQVKIGDRKLRAWFNLSDRSAMRYPVLIGRRLLHNKFIVDVSKRHVFSDEPRRVLILGAPEHRVGDFFKEVAANCEEKVSFEARSFKEILFRVGTNHVSVEDLTGGVNIASYDLVYFKTHRIYYPLAISVAEYLEHRDVRFVDRELSQHVAYDKLTEMVRLALAGLPVPLTFCGTNAALKAQAGRILAEVGSPFVCKEITADRGRNNYLLHTKEDLLEVLEQATPGQLYMVQEYIKNDGFVRVLVFDSEVAVMIGKRAVANDDPRKTHLNKPFGAPNAYAIKPEDEPAGVREIALASSRLMRRQVAGVDLIYSTDRKLWYILEVNAAPQIRTGAYRQQKITAFATFIDQQLDR
jgi:glutathione synthase/RimK-type ligase-like ATP-grasp enzyme